MRESIMDKNVFDYDSLLSQYDGDKDFVKILVATYIEETPKFIDEMKESIDSNDHQVFNRGAHSVKSSAANIRAEEVRAIAMRLEELSKTEIVGHCEPMFSELAISNSVLIEGLKGFL